MGEISRPSHSVGRRQARQRSETVHANTHHESAVRDVRLADAQRVGADVADSAGEDHGGRVDHKAEPYGGGRKHLARARTQARREAHDSQMCVRENESVRGIGRCVNARWGVMQWLTGARAARIERRLLTPVTSERSRFEVSLCDGATLSEECAMTLLRTRGGMPGAAAAPN
jgi:hypothetical protein